MEFTTVSEGLVETRTLAQLCLTFNTAYSLLICGDCNSAYHGGNIFRHLKDVHKPYKAYNTWEADLKEFIARTDMAEAYPPITTAITGLSIEKMYGCPYCVEVNSISRVQQHIRTIHKSSLAPMENVPVQAFNKGKQKAAFRVIPPEPSPAAATTPTPAPENHILDDFEAFDWTSNLQNETNGRRISPFLKRTRWPLITEGYSVKRLRETAALPRNDSLPGLQRTITKYFESAMAKITELDDLSLQKLNTPNPAKR